MEIINSKTNLYKELEKGIVSLKNSELYSVEEVFKEVDEILER